RDVSGAYPCARLKHGAGGPDVPPPTSAPGGRPPAAGAATGATTAVRPRPLASPRPESAEVSGLGLAGDAPPGPSGPEAGRGSDQADRAGHGEAHVRDVALDRRRAGGLARHHAPDAERRAARHLGPAVLEEQ